MNTQKTYKVIDLRTNETIDIYLNVSQAKAHRDRLDLAHGHIRYAVREVE